jgi:hypothetical protein
MSLLPGGPSGRELGQRLKAECPELKIIYTSGYSSDFRKGLITLNGGESFLFKTIPPQQARESGSRDAQPNMNPPVYYPALILQPNLADVSDALRSLPKTSQADSLGIILLACDPTAAAALRDLRPARV